MCSKSTPLDKNISKNVEAYSIRAVSLNCTDFSFPYKYYTCTRFVICKKQTFSTNFFISLHAAAGL